MIAYEQNIDLKENSFKNIIFHNEKNIKYELDLKYINKLIDLKLNINNFDLTNKLIIYKFTKLELIEKNNRTYENNPNIIILMNRNNNRYSDWRQFLSIIILCYNDYNTCNDLDKVIKNKTNYTIELENFLKNNNLYVNNDLIKDMNYMFNEMCNIDYIWNDFKFK